MTSIGKKIERTNKTNDFKKLDTIVLEDMKLYLVEVKGKAEVKLEIIRSILGERRKNES